MEESHTLEIRTFEVTKEWVQIVRDAGRGMKKCWCTVRKTVNDISPQERKDESSTFMNDARVRARGGM